MSSDAFIHFKNECEFWYRDVLIICASEEHAAEMAMKLLEKAGHLAY